MMQRMAFLALVVLATTSNAKPSPNMHDFGSKAHDQHEHETHNADPTKGSHEVTKETLEAFVLSNHETPTAIMWYSEECANCGVFKDYWTQESWDIPDVVRGHASVSTAPIMRQLGRSDKKPNSFAWPVIKMYGTRDGAPVKECEIEDAANYPQEQGKLDLKACGRKLNRAWAKKAG